MEKKILDKIREETEKTGQVHSGIQLLAIAVHSILLSSGLKYTGGEASEGTEELTKLEADWNDAEGAFTMKYKSADGSQRFLLKAISLDELLIVNIMNLGKPDDVVTLDVNLADHLQDRSSQKLEGNLKSLDKLFSQLQKALHNNTSTNPPKPNPQEDPHQRTTRKPPSPKEEEEEENPWSQGGIGTGYDPRVPQHPFPTGIGRGDLDPFSPTGGGMFADPRHPGFGGGGMPAPPGRGPLAYVPPGARYDPIGPGGRFPGGSFPGGGFPGGVPGAGRGGRNPNVFPGEPDPDEFYPPGFEDEFY